MDLREPYYTLSITAGGRPWDIRVNDGPVLADDIGRGTVSTEMPINRWLADGLNEISVRLTLGEGPTPGEVRLEVFAREHALPQDTKTSLLRMQVKTPPPGGPLPTGSSAPSSEGTEAPVPGGAVSFEMEGAHTLLGRQSFPASMPPPPWSWMALPPQPLTDADRAALTAEVRKFWEVLQNEEMSALKQALAARNADLHRAHYMTPQAFEQETLGQFKYLWEDDEWHLADLDTSDLEFRPFGGGRLYQPIDSVTNRSVIYFADQAEEEANYISFIFCRDGQRGWTIIR